MSSAKRTVKMLELIKQDEQIVHFDVSKLQNEATVF